MENYQGKPFAEESRLKNVANKVTSTDPKGNVLELYTWNCHPVCNFSHSPSCVEDFVNHFQSRPGDTWICAYPKSGTHWLFSILHLLVSRDVTTPAPSKDVGFIELSSANKLEKLKSPRILTTHLPLTIFKRPFVDENSFRKTKILQIIRHPLDIVVSFYHHTKGLLYESPYLGNIHDFYQLFLSGHTECGSYFHYMQEWWPYIMEHRWSATNPDGHVLLLTYENMKSNPMSSLQQIVEFLNLERLVNEPFLHKVLQENRIERLRELHAKEYESWSSEEFVKKGAMYRKGIVGDWMENFSRDEVEQFLKVYESSLSQLKDYPYGVQSMQR